MVRFAEALEKKGVSSEVVAQRILTILTNSKSKTRYRIDAQWFQNPLLSLLPKRTSDKMIAKQMSIIKK